jgi:protocatechuate 3,4-dioxygenase alpha subunit
MTIDAKWLPAGSQTVGPYFQIGLEYLIDRADALKPDAARRIEVRGRVLDRDGAPVPDALLEFWTPSASAITSSLMPKHFDYSATGYPSGFFRVATDKDGNFAVLIAKPLALTLPDGRMQAPHMLVLVFARGLLRHLLSRVYFADELANSADPVLLDVPTERRSTLIAQTESSQPNSYRWNVILQGQDETVFFAW